MSGSWSKEHWRMVKADGMYRRAEADIGSILIPRPIVRMEDTGISRGKQNQLASGYANSTSRLGRGMVVSLVCAIYPHLRQSLITSRHCTKSNKGTRRPDWSKPSSRIDCSIASTPNRTGRLSCCPRPSSNQTNGCGRCSRKWQSRSQVGRMPGYGL